MRAPFTPKKVMTGVVVLLLVAQGVTGFLLYKVNRKLDDTRAANQVTFNDLDSALQQQALVPLPGTDRLYLAELKLTVPNDAVTRTVRYNVDLGLPTENGPGDIRLSSTSAVDHRGHIKSCSDMVRLKVEDTPDPYSPEQPLYATLHLADGRTVQLYASNTKECQTAWLAVSPQKIAEAFKAAQSY